MLLVCYSLLMEWLMGRLHGLLSFLLVTMSGGLHTYVPVGDDVWWVTHICSCW